VKLLRFIAKNIYIYVNLFLRL